MDRQQSALRLIISFFGVNLLIVGLFVVLVPHEVISRITSRARRVARRRTSPQRAPHAHTAYSP